MDDTDNNADRRTGQGHTPGPWVAIRNLSYWEVNSLLNRGEDGVPYSVANVCSSDPTNPDAGLQEANARLIAAAPELLEALLAFVDGPDYISADDCVKREHAALVAIAKAKGDAS